MRNRVFADGAFITLTDLLTVPTVEVSAVWLRDSDGEVLSLNSMYVTAMFATLNNAVVCNEWGKIRHHDGWGLQDDINQAITTIRQCRLSFAAIWQLEGQPPYVAFSDELDRYSASALLEEVFTAGT